MIFRPSFVLRAQLAVYGLVCLWAALWQAWQFMERHEPKRLVGALVLVLPGWLAAAVNRRRVIVEEEGLRSITLLRTRFVSWESVRRVDQTRRSFVVETDGGPISAGWIAPGERERLLRIVLERAKLIARPGRLRWGLVAQYVPRAQPIRLQPPPGNDPELSR